MHILADVVEPTQLLVIPNAWVPFIIAVIIPVLVAGVAHVTASDRLRTIVGFLLSAVTAILTQAVVSGSDAIITWETVRLIAFTFGTELVAYMGWKGVTNNQLNAKVAPNAGIGKAA